MPLYYSNFKSFSNKISRIFWFGQLYVWPLLAIPKGQYRPCARRGRPEQGWYGWISNFWRHSKLPYDGHWISGLPKQIMPTLVDTPRCPGESGNFYQPQGWSTLGWAWFAWAAQAFSAQPMGACCDIKKLKSTHINPAPASPAKPKADIGLSV